MTVNPTMHEQVGAHNITMQVCDGEPRCSSVFVEVLVLNDAPTFVSELVNQTFRIGQGFTYTLPATKDYEQDMVTITSTEYK
jgi:hypothetical protein